MLFRERRRKRGRDETGKTNKSQQKIKEREGDISFRSFQMNILDIIINITQSLTHTHTHTLHHQKLKSQRYQSDINPSRRYVLMGRLIQSASEEAVERRRGEGRGGENKRQVHVKMR